MQLLDSALLEDGLNICKQHDGSRFIARLGDGLGCDHANPLRPLATGMIGNGDQWTPVVSGAAMQRLGHFRIGGF